MAVKINWTNRAWKTYESNIKYLQDAWTQREVNNFIEQTDKLILRLSRFPQSGRSRNKKYQNIRCAVLHKRVLLIYKYKPIKNEIDLLVFWNTWQNPKKL
ncbi:type II toxin-antitoxin system RelE/ParE family toxin [Niabella beijingensis]|uniref:type II toxin-antitoxin system RelE/ParE family toxin n=1 Tax=Niabella beijingensis TaxID=2872700 RepID=UPI001CC060AA|nr:type II toxin-antitoxin system RelE/ParE family toxin [Niabella beijingensis]